MKTKEFLVQEKDAKKRLDMFLAENFLDFTRNHLQNMINSGLVLVDGKQEKNGYKLKVNQKIGSSIFNKAIINETQFAKFPIGS